VARIAALRNSSYPRVAGPSGTLSVVLAPSIAFVQYANLRGAAYAISAEMPIAKGDWWNTESPEALDKYRGLQGKKQHQLIDTIR
jgi:hypothetical protein